jgi:hypothetical protein
MICRQSQERAAARTRHHPEGGNTNQQTNNRRSASLLPSFQNRSSSIQFLIIHVSCPPTFDISPKHSRSAAHTSARHRQNIASQPLAINQREPFSTRAQEFAFQKCCSRSAAHTAIAGRLHYVQKNVGLVQRHGNKQQSHAKDSILVPRAPRPPHPHQPPHFTTHWQPSTHRAASTGQAISSSSISIHPSSQHSSRIACMLVGTPHKIDPSQTSYNINCHVLQGPKFRLLQARLRGKRCGCSPSDRPLSSSTAWRLLFAPSSTAPLPCYSSNQ